MAKKKTSPKSKITAILLAVFVGGFGIHNFYIGKTARATAQLLMTLTLILSFVTLILVLIDIIKLASDKQKDGQGLLVTQN